MGAVAGILSLVGTGMGAYGQYRSGQDAAQVYKYNQALAKYQAQYIQQSADIEEAQLKKDVKKYMGRQRAIAGKSGTIVDEGSNLLVSEATQREADIDAAIIRYNADIASYSSMQNANLLGTQSNQLQAGSYIGAGSTLLTGLSKWDYRNMFSKSRTANQSPTLTIT